MDRVTESQYLTHKNGNKGRNNLIIEGDKFLRTCENTAKGGTHHCTRRQLPEGAFPFSSFFSSSDVPRKQKR